MTTMKKWRGLSALVADAVEHGSRAVERVQLDGARQTFRVLEWIPAARPVEMALRASVMSTHAAIRMVGNIVATGVDAGLAGWEKARPPVVASARASLSSGCSNNPNKEIKMGTQTKNPGWWSNDHTSTWDRIKMAMKRDWEQTKHDLSSDSSNKGTDLNQDAGDTVKQMSGKGPGDSKTTGTTTGTRNWDEAEPAMRYGHGAQQHYGKDHRDWDDKLEAKLRQEWNELGHSRSWDESRSHVRRGWDHGRTRT